VKSAPFSSAVFATIIRAVLDNANNVRQGRGGRGVAEAELLARAAVIANATIIITVIAISVVATIAIFSHDLMPILP